MFFVILAGADAANCMIDQPPNTASAYHVKHENKNKHTAATVKLVDRLSFKHEYKQANGTQLSGRHDIYKRLLTL